MNWYILRFLLTGQHAFLSVCKMRWVFSSFLLLKGCLSQTGQTMPTSKWKVSICSEKFVMPLNSSLDSHRMQTQINSSDQPLLPLPGPPSDLWSPAELRCKKVLSSTYIFCDSTLMMNISHLNRKVSNYLWQFCHPNMEGFRVPCWHDATHDSLNGLFVQRPKF